MFGGWVVVSVRVVVGGLRHGPGQVLALDVRTTLAYQQRGSHHSKLPLWRSRLPELVFVDFIEDLLLGFSSSSLNNHGQECFLLPGLLTKGRPKHGITEGTNLKEINCWLYSARQE